MKKIKITSKAPYHISLNYPELHINRRFDKEGQSFIFDEDKVEELFYYPGFSKSVREGILYIEDKEMRVKLGIETEAEGNVEAIAPPVLSSASILATLKAKPAKELRETLEKLPKAQQMRFAEVAIENKILDYEKNKIIKEFTGRDVAKIIELNDEN